MKIEVSHLYLAAQSFAGLLLGRSQQIDMEPLAVQKHDNPDRRQDRENSDARLDPDGDRLPALPDRPQPGFLAGSGDRESSKGGFGRAFKMPAPG